MFNVVLVHPEIPHNTGATGRLCLATGASLHLIEPLGFSLEEKHLRRAGLDYWKDVNVTVWPDWDTFLQETKAQRLHLCTTKANTSLWDTHFTKDDYLVFGCETKGLPDDIRNSYPDEMLRIPMQTDSTRSLNLATAVAIVLYEAARQIS